MYGLPAEFDGGFLVGRRLEQICINENQISLHFNADAAITIENGYSYGVAGLPVSGATTFVPALHANLKDLLGRAVSRVESTSDGTLALFFENGHALRCFDDPHYESYRIKEGARVIIV